MWDSCLAPGIDVVMTMRLATAVTWVLSPSSCHWWPDWSHAYTAYAAGRSGCIGDQLWLKAHASEVR